MRKRAQAPIVTRGSLGTTLVMNTLRRPVPVAVLGLLSLACAPRPMAEVAEVAEGRADVDPSRLSLEVPMGSLGYRVGTYLEIEGVRDTGGMVGHSNLLVDTVRGEKLDRPVSLLITNLRGGQLPLGTRCVVRGYESARMIGLPDEVVQTEGLPPTQAMWQMQRFFVMTSAVEPEELEM